MADFVWKSSYPAGVAIDAPIVVSTLPALLDEAVAKFGPRAAIEFRGRSSSYDALGETSERVAAAFMRAGLRPGEVVALYLPNTPYHPLAFFGALKAGLRIAHLSPLDAPRELAHKLQDSGARTLVTTNVGRMLEAALALREAGLVDRLIVGDDADYGPSPAPVMPIPDGPGVISFTRFIDGARLPIVRPPIAPEDLALLQYTGGTTGPPKGAMLSHANLTAAVASYEAWSAGDALAEDRSKVICVLPLFHIYALTTVLLRGLKRGSELMLRMRFDVEQTLDDIEIKRATAFPGVPTMWIALVNHSGLETRDLTSLTICSSGGAPLPIEIGDRFERLSGHRLGGGWGMTETAPAGTQIPRDGPQKPGTIGVPLPGIEMDVASLDDPHRVLPLGEIGELRVRGRNVTTGYWNRPDDNATSFAGDFFLTGDIGYMDADGFFFIVDRKKDMILSGGFNVYPQVIEQAIHEYPSVREAAVIGIPDAYRGEAAKAFVTLREGAVALDLDTLNAFLKARIGKQSLPAALEIRDSLPHTPVGKLAKTELRAEEARKRQAAASAAQSKTASASEAN